VADLAMQSNRLLPSFQHISYLHKKIAEFNKLADAAVKLELMKSLALAIVRLTRISL